MAKFKFLLVVAILPILHATKAEKEVDECDSKPGEWESQRCYIFGESNPHNHWRETPCATFRRQGGGAPHLLKECMEKNSKDMCYWLRNKESKTIEAGCICEAFLKKYAPAGKNCTEIDEGPFKGRGEVCTCSGFVPLNPSKGAPEGYMTGCNERSEPENAPHIADRCGGPWWETTTSTTRGGARTKSGVDVLKSCGLFTSLLTLILSVFYF